jgi:hypothetical protein
MNWPPVKRSAPGREITGGAKLRLTQSYQSFGTSQLAYGDMRRGSAGSKRGRPVLRASYANAANACLVAFLINSIVSGVRGASRRKYS